MRHAAVSWMRDYCRKKVRIHVDTALRSAKVHWLSCCLNTMAKLPSLLLTLVVYLIPLAFAQAWNRPNDKDIGSVNAASYGCTATCQAILTGAIELDRTTIYGNIPFDTAFYATSPKFSPTSSKPGDLLKVQAYVHTAPDSAWSIPGGTTLFRIQYVSAGINDEPVPATAFVAIPFARRTDGKPFSMVALAHGTVGTHYGCAPSTSFNLYDYDTWRPIFLTGYAVVATDYTGLGNNYVPHYWQANSLNGNDVYYSAVAAKAAFPDWLSDEWVAIGHSQGGGAIWGLAENPAVASGPLTLLGAAALEPAVRTADEVAYDIESVGSGTSSGAALATYVNYLYAALDAIEPGSANHIFTPAFIQRQRLGNALGACFYAEASLDTDIVEAGGLTSILRNASEVPTDPVIRRFQTLYGAGTGKPAQTPLLVVQSTGDMTIPYPVVDLAYRATCTAGGEPLQLSFYHAVDHGTSLGAISPEWLQFIADRFAGVPWVTKCTVVRHRAVDKAAAYLPLDF